MCIQVNVIGPRGGLGKIIDVCDHKQQLNDITVLQMKQKITKEMNLDGDLRIVYEAKTLEEEATLGSLNIQHLSVLHTLLRLPGGQR